MWTVKFWNSSVYRTQAEYISAQINLHLPDTCEIEEGQEGQFEIFHSGKLFMKAEHGNFFDFEDIKKKLSEDGKTYFDLE